MISSLFAFFMGYPTYSISVIPVGYASFVDKLVTAVFRWRYFLDIGMFASPRWNNNYIIVLIDEG